ncbi:MAG: TIGR02530 family flagellar biosynthesis protein [Candidatus Kapaibacteriales bacterium]
MEINGVRLPFIPIHKIDEANRKASTNISKPIENSNFQKVLEETFQTLKLSKHAQSRIISREIEFNSEVVEKLQQAFSQAQAKGSNETLILFKDKMFLVSVKNQTIISVFDQQSLEKNVFTNIDSVVFAE